MGRHDFRPASVLRTASQLLATKRIERPPVWFDVIHDVPSPRTQTLVRPVQWSGSRSQKRKPSKMFQPTNLKYKEDGLRSEFFGDHPWELARPRVVLEDGGNDAKDWDWSRIQQPGKALNGESVVQRQRWLMQHENLLEDEAYDKARKEFYDIRLQQDIERRVAKEEALAFGSYFGKGPNEIGMELEDVMWEDWKKWAIAETERLQQLAQSGYSSVEEEEVELTAGEEAEVLDEVAAESVPATKAGQEAKGGVALFPGKV